MTRPQFTRDDRRPLYHMERQHGASIEIGRRSETSRVVPVARSEKWLGEVWLEVAAKGVIPRPGRPERVTEDLLEIDCDRPGRGRTKGETHRFRSGSLKWEVIYEAASDMPEEGYIAFDLSNPPGLEFFYQPALTQEEIETGSERPENVIGSYAAYYGKQGCSKTSDGTVLTSYETGKYCHIYRPEWVAANGARLWGTQEIVGTELRIAIPTQWLFDLGAAAFPLVLDPTFGYETRGASTRSFSTYKLKTGNYSTAADGGGTLTTVSAWIRPYGQDYTVGAYADSSGSLGSLLGDDAGSAPAGDNAATQIDQTIDSPQPTLANSTSYWLAIASDGSSVGSIYYDSSGTTKEFTDAYYSGSLPSSPSSGEADRSYMLSIWGTTVAAGGGATRNIIIGGGVI